MGFKSLKRFRRLLRFPPHILALKVAGKIGHRINCFYGSRRDLRSSTYLRTPVAEINHLLNPLPVEMLRPLKDEVAALTEHYLAHRFDLLGSGWVQVKHGMRCRGLEGYVYDAGPSIDVDSQGHWLECRINKANLLESQRIWQLIDPNYTPIDWHLDFKSGYRWSEDTWYQNILHGHKPGVDVKVPWELARMQHLPQLACAYALAMDEQPGFMQPEIYLREFTNQVLDFIATNPPRFGVNWRCTMDVAIRAANWLVTYDLFRCFGAQFAEEFEVGLSTSIYQHGLHIVNNLEWSKDFTSNHYLSDIVGLLFISMYLPRSTEVDTWLALAVRELVHLVQEHFAPDGSHFEGSTSYHRLSTEMVVYGTALVLGMPDEKLQALMSYDHTLIKTGFPLEPAPVPLYPLLGESRLTPFPQWYLERLEKMAEFVMHITKPNGHIPQVGDNDSGRFLKLQPVYQRMSVKDARDNYINLDGYDELPDDAIFWDENVLDHRHIVATVNGIFNRDDVAVYTGREWIEYELIRRLVGDVHISSYRKQDEVSAAELYRINSEEGTAGENNLSFDLSNEGWFVEETIVSDPGLLDDIHRYAYPDFGLYVYCSKRLYLAIRCGKVGLNGRGGHDHNDQLSVELCIDGDEKIRDPGTYLYTPLPQRRNQYRSVKAHFTPYKEGTEPAGLDTGVFILDGAHDGECLRFDDKEFYAKHRDIELLIRLVENQLTFAARTKSGKLVWETPHIYYSNGYGKLVR